MRIMEIGKETGNFAAGLRDTALPDGTGVCLIGLALEDSDPFEIWVGEYTRELIMALKQEYEAVCEKRRKYLIVMLAEDMKDPFAQAAADGCWEARHRARAYDGKAGGSSGIESDQRKEER